MSRPFFVGLTDWSERTIDARASSNSFGPAQPAPGEDRVHTDQARRQAEPGEGVGQVVVRDVENRLSPLRQSARVRRSILIDREGRRIVEMQDGRDGGRIACEPLVPRRIVVRREEVARLGFTHQARDRHATGNLPVRPCRRVEPLADPLSNGHSGECGQSAKC